MVEILTFATSFFIAYILIPYIKKFGIRSNILAYPNERSIHEVPVPTMGGMSFFISFLFSFLLFRNAFSQKAFILGAIMIFIVGLIDDSTDLRPILKLIGQIISVGIFLTIYFLSNSVSTSLSFNIFIYLFSYIFMLGIINAINLTDGLDGLAAGIFIISALEYSYLFYGLKEFLIIILSLLGGVIAFLFFNFYPAKIFMGDTGSNFLGFSLGVLSFYVLIYYGFFPGIIYILLILSVPIIDTLFAIIRRIIKKQPIFKADKGHIHHILIKLGFSQPRAVLIIWTISASSFIPLLIVNKNKITLLHQIFILLIYYTILIWGIIYINKKLRGAKNV